jgi:tRNA U55 pseudouridine synthase TruB
MARKRKGEKIDGWVVLDKPIGLGSTPAVSRVRRLFGAQKAGHGGTLSLWRAACCRLRSARRPRPFPS